MPLGTLLSLEGHETPIWLLWSGVQKSGAFFFQCIFQP